VDADGVVANGAANPCLAPLMETGSCAANACPVLSAWSEWTACSQTCGGGTRSRLRKCVAVDASSAGAALKCDGALEETAKCNVDACPVWSEWAAWSDCSSTCGGGKRTASRKCLNGKTEVKGACQGQGVKEETCNPQKCPGTSSVYL
jgi:hypothetical protein